MKNPKTNLDALALRFEKTNQLTGRVDGTPCKLTVWADLTLTRSLGKTGGHHSDNDAEFLETGLTFSTISRSALS